MKTLKLLSLFCLILISGYSYAQSIDGIVTLNGLSPKSILKETTVVDLFLPIEAFDMIPGIQKAGIMPTPKLAPDQMDTPLPKGTYDVTLEMVSSSETIKGSIKPLTFSFIVK